MNLLCRIAIRVNTVGSFGRLEIQRPTEWNLLFRFSESLTNAQTHTHEITKYIIQSTGDGDDNRIQAKERTNGTDWEANTNISTDDEITFDFMCVEAHTQCHNRRFGCSLCVYSFLPFLVRSFFGLSLDSTICEHYDFQTWFLRFTVVEGGTRTRDECLMFESVCIYSVRAGTK